MKTSIFSVVFGVLFLAVASFATPPNGIIVIDGAKLTALSNGKWQVQAPVDFGQSDFVVAGKVRTDIQFSMWIALNTEGSCKEEWSAEVPVTVSADGNLLVAEFDPAVLRDKDNAKSYTGGLKRGQSVYWNAVNQNGKWMWANVNQAKSKVKIDALAVNDQCGHVCYGSLVP